MNVFTGTASGPVVQTGDITGGLIIDTHTIRTANASSTSASASEGALAEQHHQVYDLDTDATHTIPGATCPACPPRS